MDIKKPQLVKVEAFAYFFQSGIPGHIQDGSLEKMRVLQHPPQNFQKNQRSDFITRSLHLLHYDLANFISVVDFLVEPFITALSALFESISHAGEQFSVSVAVIELIVFLSPCAVAGVKRLVLFSARSGGCAYSVGGHFGCHTFKF